MLFQSNNSQAKKPLSLRPAWKILSGFAADGIVATTDPACVNGIPDDPRSHSAVLFFYPKPLPQGGVGHEVTLHVSPAGMEITGPNSIILAHIPQLLVREQDSAGMFAGRFKQWAGQCSVYKEIFTDLLFGLAAIGGPCRSGGISASGCLACRGRSFQSIHPPVPV